MKQNLDEYLDSQIQEIRQTVGDSKVLLGLSGGIDASVTAVLLNRAIGKNLICVFVDTGLMRHNEGDEVETLFKQEYGVNFIRVNAKERFLGKLKGITNPEAKRKIIGEEFIRVFEDEAKKLGQIDYFAQGTNAADIAESDKSALVKSHHNVALPDVIDFKGIVEPLKSLFKYQIRELGLFLGLPHDVVYRQPFPGPGLAVRCMGEVTEEKVEVLRLADYIVREEIGKLEQKPSQYFAIMTDTYSVGVKNDKRTFEPVVAIRAVDTKDFMTGAYTALPHDVLGLIAKRITSEVDGVSRVVYDITSKPPGTVEWE